MSSASRRFVFLLLGACALIGLLVFVLHLGAEDVQAPVPEGPPVVAEGVATDTTLAGSNAVEARADLDAVREHTKTASLIVRVLIARPEPPEPVVGCTLRIAWLGAGDQELAGQGVEGVTTVGGLFVTPVPPGMPVRITALPLVRPVTRTGVRGRSLIVEPLSDGEQREVVLAVEAGCESSYFGRVVDALNGQPIAEAVLVPLRIGTLMPNETVLSTTVGVDGRFELCQEGLEADAARVRAAGYSTALIELKFQHETAEQARLIELLPEAGLVVKVRSPRKLGVLRVELKLPAYELAKPEVSKLYGNEERYAAQSNGELVRFTSLPARVPMIATLFENGAQVAILPDKVLLEPKEVRTLEWPLGGGTRVSGRVLDQLGAPGWKAPILLCKHALAGDPKPGRCYFYTSDKNESVQRTQADEQGLFVLDDVPPGRYWVGVDRVRQDWDGLDPQALAPIGEFLEVAAEIPGQEVVIRTARGLFLFGRVVRPDGSSAGRQHVSVECPSVKGFMACTSGDDGRFAVGPLIDDEHTCGCSMADGFAPSEPVTARPGGPEILLRLLPGASLAGHAVDAAGATHPGCKLTVSRVGEGEMWWSSTLDIGGAFEVDGLRPGDHQLAVVSSDGLAGIAGPFALERGEAKRDLKVVLAPGGRVTVRYLGQSRYANFDLLRGTVLVHGDGLETGTSQTCVAPAGALRVVMKSRDGRREERELQLAVGETREVVFDWR